jgi:hypothetical protein
MKYVYSFTHGRLLERDLEDDHQCDHSLEYLKTICNEPLLYDPFLQMVDKGGVASRMIAHLKENHPELLL